MKPGRFNLAREGYPFLLVFAFLCALGAWIYWPLGVLFGVLFLFSVYFFRDPRRQPPANERLLVSPADGRVLKIEQLATGPYLRQPHQRISIFMSPLDVHVNSIPCDGTIQEVRYHPGKFLVASLDKASEHNERNAVILKTPQGQEVAFVQIAGLVARRIVCYAKAQMAARRGERYWLIRFGSRMEVCLPSAWPVLVQVGQKVKAVATALAEMK